MQIIINRHAPLTALTFTDFRPASTGTVLVTLVLFYIISIINGITWYSGNPWLGFEQLCFGQDLTIILDTCTSGGLKVQHFQVWSPIPKSSDSRISYNFNFLCTIFLHQITYFTSWSPTSKKLVHTYYRTQKFHYMTFSQGREFCDRKISRIFS